jgi:hypothetical protein
MYRDEDEQDDYDLYLESLYDEDDTEDDDVDDTEDDDE